MTALSPAQARALALIVFCGPARTVRNMTGAWWLCGGEIIAPVCVGRLVSAGMVRTQDSAPKTSQSWVSRTAFPTDQGRAAADVGHLPGPRVDPAASWLSVGRRMSGTPLDEDPETWAPPDYHSRFTDDPLPLDRVFGGETS